MNELLIERTSSAYTSPLLIKNLLAYPVVNNHDQEIVYRDHLGFDSRTLCEQPLAQVVPGDSAPNEKQLVSFVKGFVDSGRLTRHAMMLKVLVVDEISKTSVGKVDKKLLRNKHL